MLGSNVIETGLIFAMATGIRANPVLYFSWVDFGFVAVGYTVAMFLGEFASDMPHIFSRRNARPRYQVVIGHCAFLAIILAFMQLLPQIEPWLPNSLTNGTLDRFGRHRSGFRDLGFVLLVGLYAIERWWVVVKRDSRPMERKTERT